MNSEQRVNYRNVLENMELDVQRVVEVVADRGDELTEPDQTRQRTLKGSPYNDKFVYLPHVLIAPTMDLPLGTIVTVPQGRGVVRFVGTTSFKEGKWLGIELDDANGKNDGSIEGIRYFTCRKGYGVFIRPSQIKATHGSEMPPVSIDVSFIAPCLHSVAAPGSAGANATSWPPAHV